MHTAPAPETRFEIAYEESLGTRYNHDFQGKGSLVVLNAGTRFVFSGPRRALPGFRHATELALDRTQIWNVSVEGRRVQFATRVGRSRQKNRRFMFLCRTAEEATSAGQLLPDAKETEFAAGEEFAKKLNQLAGPAGPWASVTNLVVAANVVVFLLMGLAGAGWIEVADMMPYLRFGANRPDITTDGEWWRLVACMFMHYGFVHLLLNMWALLQAGHLTEKLFGRAAYVLAYFGSGITASVASLLWHREHQIASAGASGAVFGVYGALLGYVLREKHGLPKVVFQPLLKSTLAFAGYNLLYGFAHPGIDNAAHVGGLAGGVLLGWLLALPIDAEARREFTAGRLKRGLAAMVVVVATGIMLAPRFDYRLMDEVAWGATNKEPTAKEKEILKHQEAAMDALSRKGDTAGLALWLTQEGIPFYSRWRDAVLSLQLAPGRATARRREGMARILRMKVEAYERLLAGAAKNDANAFETYRRDEEKIANEIKALGKRAG